jgi:hypothetical protein
MKKIGILFGQEHSFPPALVERVNQKTGGKDILSEFVKIDKVIQGEPCDYDVVIDRISQDVPFYRAWLKNAALTGTAVVNNPFWWSADEKFFNRRRIQTINHFATWNIRSIGKGSSNTSGGRRSSNHSPAADGKMFTGCITPMNFFARITKRASSS